MFPTTEAHFRLFVPIFYVRVVLLRAVARFGSRSKSVVDTLHVTIAEVTTNLARYVARSPANIIVLFYAFSMKILVGNAMKWASFETGIVACCLALSDKMLSYNFHGRFICRVWVSKAFRLKSI